MKNSKKKVYDVVYGSKEISYESPKGVIGFLYRKFIRFEVNRYQASYELLPSGGEKLLDIGCGGGDFIFMVKNKFKECYGVDVSSMRIKQAKQKVKDDAESKKFAFHENDVDEGLIFPDSFFDVVTCIAVLEHVFNPPNLVEEIFRVLKPGGIFIVEVPNIAWIPYRIELLFGDLPKTGGVYLGADWEHLHNFTYSLLCSLLKNYGFKIVKTTCSGIFNNIRIFYPSVLAADIIVKAQKMKYPI
jgi:ubiquinone/menaquinone biosynthesis C-methylase UbiE